MGMQKKAKIVNLGDDVQYKAVFLWFKQKQMPIMGPMLCEKAIQLHKKLHHAADGDQSQFSGSTGW